MKLNMTSIGFKTVTVLLKPLFCLWYNPQVVGKGNIPENGAVVIACNHKHIMDQCMAIIATKRTVNYMAKSEYFKGRAAFFFKILMSRIGKPIFVEGKSVEQVNIELKNSVSELIRDNLESGYGTENEYKRAEKYFGEKITDYKNIDFLDFDGAI